MATALSGLLLFPGLAGVIGTLAASAPARVEPPAAKESQR